MNTSWASKRVIITIFELVTIFSFLTLRGPSLNITYMEYSNALDKVADIVNGTSCGGDNSYALEQISDVINGRSCGHDNNDHTLETLTSRETYDIESSDALFSKRYRYNTPIETSDTSSTYDCGSEPLYSTFFSQTSNYRSYINEDKIIYETFFKEHIVRDDTFKGTYVELGALDGMRYSDTRFYDQCLGWYGLLIESDPKMFDMLSFNRPNAHQINFAPVCEKSGETIQLAPAASVSNRFGRKEMQSDDAHLDVNVPCGPLSPVLEDVFADHGMRINFFVLHMNGSEDTVLNTIDFNKVQIDVMMVGLDNNDCTQYGICNVRDNVQATLKAAGFIRYDTILFSETLDVYVHGKSKFQIDLVKKGLLASQDVKRWNNPPPSTGYYKLPNIQMIGVGRAGTTVMSEWLFGYPMNSASGICRPAVFEGEPSFFNKEVHFFDHPDRYVQGIDFYAQRFKDCTKYRYVMDATPDTFRHPKNVHDTYRQAGGNQHTELKIILFLREPSTREFSHYNHMLHTYLKEPRRDKWYSSIESNATGMPLSFDEYVGNFLLSNPVEINDLPMSLYSHNLGEWIKYFRRDQILIISYDSMCQSSTTQQGRIRAFLGAEFPGQLSTGTIGTPTPMEADKMTCTAQSKLNTLFETMTDKLYSFLDQNPGPVMEDRPFPKFRQPSCRK